MKIIALNGYARSGKDTAASVLVDEYGFSRVAFADKLREVLYALNPIVWKGRAYDGGNHPTGWKSIYVQDVIDDYGWNRYKETAYGDEIRRLLQRLGTEAGRETLWDSIWIDAALNGTDAEKVVISDMRFKNEMRAVLDRDGILLRINRAGVGPANSHSSEIELSTVEFENVLENDGSLDEYRDRVRAFANEAGL